MPTRLHLATTAFSLTLALLAAGCAGGLGSPDAPGTGVDEDDEERGAVAPERPEDAVPIVQASTPPILGPIGTPGLAAPAPAPHAPRASHTPAHPQAHPPGKAPAHPAPGQIQTPFGAVPASTLGQLTPMLGQLPGGFPQFNPGPGFMNADMPAPTTGPVLDGEKLGHDPQVAVSDRFLVVYTAHRYKFVDKATGKTLAAEGEIPPYGDFNTLFSPLWSPRDHRGQPNPENINTRLAFTAGDPLGCDPEQPTNSNACVQEFYDSRIMWDSVRRRFWIESAARNHLWFCKDGDACNGPKQTRTQARRYIAIAVSKTEDPRQGFHRFILVNQYTDWPKIAVNEHYLVLGHRSSNVMHVYDADKLAAGNPDRGAVKAARIDDRWLRGAKAIAPVTQHGPTNGLTFLLGSDGSTTVRIFGLFNADPNRAVRPIVVAGPPVDIGHNLGSIEGNAIYRNGFLYVARDEWVPGHEREARQIRVTRIPMRIGQGRNAPTIWSSNDPRYGYLEVVIGAREPDDPPGDLLDYEKPAIDVNGNGDMVVVYDRKSWHTRADVPPEVRYSIIYHNEARARPGLLIRRGTTSAVPDINDNGKAGIDLAYAQVDPSDDRTIWVTHAYADAHARWFKQIVAAVRP